MQDVNTAIWSALYEGGNYLNYPSEVFVSLFMRFLGKAKPQGRFLDHGCGSGNNAEFLARRGWTVTGADVSARALEVTAARLADFGGAHETTPLDAARPLKDQIGAVSHVVCWDCLYYNALPKAKQDAADLVAALAPGGLIFLNMPTPAHEFATTGLRLDDGSVRNQRKGTRQEGAIMAIPENLDDLVSWLPGCEIVEKGHFTFDFSGFREFMLVVAKKGGAA